jgi:hypothetical protein
MALARFRAAPLLAASLAVTAGCLVDDDDQATVPQEVGGAGCPYDICGSNHSKLSVPFYELFEDGTANDQGLKLEGIYYGAVKWNVDVVGSELKARNGALVKTGANVVGGVMRVTDSHGTVFRISVDEAIVTPLYPLGTGTTWAYVLNWRVWGSRDAPVNLCTAAGDLVGEQDTLYQNAYSTVLFEGERYDEEKLEIKTNAPTAGVFNFGCAGHILAKMHMTHHTASSSSVAYSTDVDERQTMMRMFAADYCGTGNSFTVGGQELSFTDEDGALPHVWNMDQYPLKIEARWSPRGATCLETPRLEGTTNPDALAEFGADVGQSIWHLIDAECALPPRCSDVEDVEVKDTWTKHLLSANPQF